MLSYDLNITQSGNEVLRCIKVNLRIPAYTLHYFFEDFLEITITWFINYRKKYNQSYLVLVCRVEVSFSWPAAWWHITLGFPSELNGRVPTEQFLNMNYIKQLFTGNQTNNENPAFYLFPFDKHLVNNEQLFQVIIRNKHENKQQRKKGRSWSHSQQLYISPTKKH